MATRYTQTFTSILAAGALGASLYTASTAGDGRAALGLSYTAHGQILTAQDAGAADAVAPVAITPSTTGYVLTMGDAGLPVWRAPASNSNTLTVTRYYADDFTPEAGSESASGTGTDDAARITLGASSTSRTYGTSGATAARAVLTLPAGTRDVTVTVYVSAASGLSTGGFRWLGIALRNAADGAAPARLWGVGLSDATTYGVGDLMSGANGAGATTGIVGIGLGSADRWYSVAFGQRRPFVGLLGSTGSSTPTGWAVPAGVSQASTAGTLSLANTTGATALAIWLQSFGGGGASSITFGVTADVVVGP